MVPSSSTKGLSTFFTVLSAGKIVSLIMDANATYYTYKTRNTALLVSRNVHRKTGGNIPMVIKVGKEWGVEIKEQTIEQHSLGDILTEYKVIDVVTGSHLIACGNFKRRMV